MATADVVVVGAGLAGMTAAIRLAGAGARVEVVARGHAATHWTAGGFDIAAPAGARTSDEAVAALAARHGHPYATVGSDVAPAVTWLREVLAGEGLVYAGDVSERLAQLPTAIGGTRPASIVPAHQAAGLAPWRPGELLVVCGIAGFKDFWAESIAASLRRGTVWAGGDPTGTRPARVDAVTVDLPGVRGRRNLSAIELARLFDDPAWREDALRLVARAVVRLARPSGLRIALPAVLGLAEHAAVLRDAERIVPGPVLEVSLVPPSVPGLRLYDALRAALRRRGGRLILGEGVSRVETVGGRVTALAASAAARERAIRTGALVLATGGIAGGGLHGLPDGTLEEPVLGLPVEAPARDDWFRPDPMDELGHPLEAAGIRTDDRLRPVGASGEPVFANVAVVGAMLAGQRYLVERCGDGVAIASAYRAAEVLGARPGTAAPAAAGAPT